MGFNSSESPANKNGIYISADLKQTTPTLPKNWKEK